MSRVGFFVLVGKITDHIKIYIYLMMNIESEPYVQNNKDLIAVGVYLVVYLAHKKR